MRLCLETDVVQKSLIYCETNPPPPPAIFFSRWVWPKIEREIYYVSLLYAHNHVGTLYIVDFVQALNEFIENV